MVKNNTTEQDLIEKTVNVIDKNGYQDLSLRKLTKMIGLTTGAFYKHFDSKDDLFRKVSIELSEQFMDHLNLKDEQSAFDQILIIANYFVHQTQSHPQIMDFLFFNSNTSLINKDVNLTEFPLLKKMALLSRDANNSELSDQDFFLQIWSFIQGYAQLVKNGITSYDAHLVRQTLFNLTNGK